MSYKFKVGDKGKTRRGSRYRVVADDRLHGRFPVVALVEWRNDEHPDGVGEALEGFTSTGGYSLSAHENDGDLLPPTVTKYLNAWYNTTTRVCGACLHPSAQAAKDAAASAAAASADRTYVQVAVPVEVPES